MNRDFKGIWIPKELWECKELSTSEKIVLLEIDSLDTGEDGCYASIKHFAELTDKAYGTAANIIHGLHSKGWIEFKGRGIAPTQKFHEKMKQKVVIVHEKVKPISRNREPYKESNTIEQSTIISQAGPAQASERVNWDNAKTDLQRFMGYYIQMCMPEIYKNGSRLQVAGFFKQYGKLFSTLLATAGSLDVAKMALDEANRFYVSKGLNWGLKALSTNFGEFVNAAMEKRRKNGIV